VLTIEVIRERLTEIRLRHARRNIVDQGLVRRIKFEGGEVTITLALPPLDEAVRSVLERDIRRAVGALPEVKAVRVEVETSAPGTTTPASPRPIPGVRHLVAISSVKGGVGKSTVTVHLALAMRDSGLRVGILDLDVYGPSLPVLLGVAQTPEMSETQRLRPIEHLGMQLMSVGFFLEEDAPVIWRGPVVMSLARQFLRDVDWHDLDVLLVDLPPGTGDAPLSLLQLVPIDGGVIVTTPQEVALHDVERGVAMFRTVAVPVFGIVENMSYYDCPHCGQREEVFSSGGGAALSQQYRVPLLARVPLSKAVQEPLAAEASREREEIAALFGAVAGEVLRALEGEAHADAPRIIN
jgi:ATP-binding protein involved in chromosome partitioning